jgi:molybdate transport system substrate-binding protein
LKKQHIFLFLLVLSCHVLLINIIGCSKPESSAKELMIFAAAGAKPPIEEAVKIFEQKYGIKISVNYGGAGEVLSNMIISKMGDAYIAPEQRYMNKARQQGAIDADAKVYSLAYMIPVIGVKKGNPINILSLADLTRPGIKVVMGNPETMMLGELVPLMLQQAGLYDMVKPNIVTYVPQVTNIITVLKMSQADAGIIWHNFGITASNDIDIIWIPREYVIGIGEIQVAVASYSKEIKATQKFIDFLISPEGNEIFNQNGYITDRITANKNWQETQ